MEDNLKECPFCGGSASMKNIQNWHWVRCNDCDAETSGADNEEDAISQWSTRFKSSSGVKP